MNRAMNRRGLSRKSRRLALVGSALAVIGLAVGLILFALRDNVVFFYGPSELAEKAVQPGTRLRIGGLVKEGSIQRAGNRDVTFVVTDTNMDVAITYSGLIPDLFREGQGIVAEGVLTAPAQFRADTLLAKHDENYMPREVADSLKKQGLWQHGGEAE